MTDIACWITFFADGARRNSSRWDLYSRLGDTGFLRADGMIASPESLYGNSPYLTRVRLTFFLDACRPAEHFGFVSPKRVFDGRRGDLALLLLAVP